MVQLGIEHVNPYYSDDANTAQVPSYIILTTSASYSIRLGLVSAQSFLGINNLTDQKYASSAFINPATCSASGAFIQPAFLEPGLPRNLFGGLNIHIEL